MSLDLELLGAGAPGWAERITLTKLYDLGKFFFTVATATMGFIFTAAKINPAIAWGLLVVAALVAIVMVIVATPHIKDPTAAKDPKWTQSHRDLLVRAVGRRHCAGGLCGTAAVLTAPVPPRRWVLFFGTSTLRSFSPMRVFAS
jgi:hypothetical protein